MKRLVLNKWYWWISNDPNIWGVGSVFNAEWVELRENSKKVKLSKWTYSNSYVSSSDTVVWYNYYDWTKYLRLHSSGKIANISKNNVDNWNYVTDLAWVSYNIGNLTTPVWEYWFVISSWNLYQWLYNTSSASLWIYNDTSNWIIDNSWFSYWTWWTIWAWWTISWWQATHTAWWWTASLSYKSTTLTWVTYRIEVVCWAITADSCQLRIWWVSKYTFSSSDSWKTVIFNYTASNNEIVEFVPFNNFAWSFDYVNWQEYNITSYSKNFNKKAPYNVYSNFIYIWNWNKITRVDTTISTWVIKDVFTIDLDYTIKAITRISDQFFIYASNGSNTRQYAWDGVSTLSDRIITWVDKNCVNVANWWNQDYLITSTSWPNRTVNWWNQDYLIPSTSWTNRTGLWLVNGYQLQDLFINSENTNSSNERIYFISNYTNAIETIGKRLLIPWNEWIYTYWQYTPWLPTSLVKEYIHLWWEISAMSYNESNSNRIVYSYAGTINWTTWIYEDLIQITWGYNLRTDMSGFVELQPHTWECISNIKSLEKLTIWAKLTSWTQINIYSKNEDRTTQYANIPYDYTTIPTVWAVYTSWWNTYTVYDVTDIWSYCILHCTYTGTATVTAGTFTKSSWTWDTPFYSERVRYGYKLLWQITDTTKRRHRIDATEEYYEIQIAYQLLTSSTSKTPEFSDINLYFNETNDD